MNFPHRYLLVKLALLLLVFTSLIERIFSAMKIIKTNLRNRISNFLNDTVITYFEDDFFESVSNDNIMLLMYHFRDMMARRGQLP